MHHGLTSHLTERVWEVELIIYVATEFEHLKVVPLKLGYPIDTPLIKFSVLTRVCMLEPDLEADLDEVSTL